jgi:hypothetical protein
MNVTIAFDRLVSHHIPVTAESTAELVQHTPGDQPWYALLVDGRHYDLILWKHTIGRPETETAMAEALAAVQAAIATAIAPAIASAERYTAEQVDRGIRHTFFETRATFKALSANEQRVIFGAVPFGRMPVKHDARRGGVHVQWRTISRDWCYQFFTYQQIADAINRGERVRVQR